jgi:hypothetical protein
MFDVWGNTDLFLFTSNPIVNKQGLAVMGRGIAKQLADKHPQIRRDFGALLTDWWEFTVDIIGDYDGQKVGYFVVKDHWKDNAKLDIIEQSCSDLVEGLERCPRRRIDLNFPGIGNGKLRREDVLPIISKLPDNVHVWEYGE